MAYTVYHLHSDDSLLDSCTKYSEYVDLAVAQGMKATWMLRRDTLRTFLRSCFTDAIKRCFISTS